MAGTGTGTLSVAFTIPNDYVTPGTVTLTSATDAETFQVGSVCIIPTGGPQPYVGQVTANLFTGQFSVITMSVGSAALGQTIGTANQTIVTFGNAVTQWTAAPGNRQYQYNVYWPTDPSLVPAGVSWTFAKGDGVTDDSFAINNALQLAAANPGGGIVMLPAGTFLCNSTVAVPGVGVHLWGVGRSATVIRQGKDAAVRFNPAVILVAGTTNSVMHLTVEGLPGTTACTMPTGVAPGTDPFPPNSDPSYGAGWAILCALATNVVIEDVDVSSTAFGVGSIVAQDIHIRFCHFQQVLFTYAGVYAQGQTGGNALGSLAIGGSLAPTDTITITLTDDNGYSVVIEYPLSNSDTSPAIVATNLAAAINASGATYFVFASPSGSSVTLTAAFGGTQGNSYTVAASTTGGVTVTPTQFANGSGQDSPVNVEIESCQCRGFKLQNINPSGEAYHCDGGVFTFIVRSSGGSNTGYHTRVANLNTAIGSTMAGDPQQIELKDISSDHTVNGLVFEHGQGLVIENSLVTNNLGGVLGIDIKSTFGKPNGTSGLAEAAIRGNQIVNQGSQTGIHIATGGVQVHGNTFSFVGTGVKMAGTVSDIEIVGNRFANSQGTGIDLTPVTNSDWITITGNAFVGVPMPIQFPTGAGGMAISVLTAESPITRAIIPRFRPQVLRLSRTACSSQTRIFPTRSSQ